jgi:hypothetical protein
MRSIGGTARRNLASVAGAAAIAAAVVAANAFTCGIGWRMDVTESSRYSLPPEAVTLLGELPDLVIATAYFANLPEPLADARAQIEEVLAEYERLSAGELTWRAADPSKDPRLADELTSGGIHPLALADRGERIWFAVRFEFRGEHIDWTPLDPAAAAETAAADFAQHLRRLVQGRPRIGITRGFGEVGETAALREPGLGFANLYDIAPIDWDRRTDAAYLDDIDLLVVNGPTEPVSPDAIALLDAFIMSGRPVVFLIRGIAWSREKLPEVMAGGEGKLGFQGVPSRHGLDGILAHLGFRIGPDTVLDEEGAPGFIPVGRLSWRTPLYFPIGHVTEAGRTVLGSSRGAPIPFASTVEIATGAAGQGAASGPRRPALTALLIAGPRARMVSGGHRLSEDRLEPPAGASSGGSIILAAVAEGAFAHYPGAAPGPMLGAEVPAGSPEQTRIAVVGSSVLIEDSLFVMMESAGEPAFWGSFVLFDRLLAWALREPTSAERGVVDLRPLPPGAEQSADLARWTVAGGVPLVASGLWLMCAWAARARRRREKARWLRLVS